MRRHPRIVGDVLDIEGYACYAETGEEGLARIAERPYDLSIGFFFFFAIPNDTPRRFCTMSIKSQSQCFRV